MNQLQGAALQLQDMPVGFATEPPDNTRGKGICGHPPVATQVPDLAEASVTYSKGTLGPFVKELLASYKDTASAHQFMTTFEGNLNCTSYQDTDGTNVAVAPVNFAKVGDETIAFRVKSSAATGDYVLLRQGTTVIEIAQAGVVIESDLTSSLSTRALDRRKASG